MAVFVRYVTPDVNLEEELLDLIELKDRSCRVDINEALETLLVKPIGLINKLVSVTTDGAPAMVGKYVGLIGLLKSDPKYPVFSPIHCLVNREHLEAKHFKFSINLKTRLEVVNFDQRKRQFKNFIKRLNLADKPSDLSFYFAVRWLSSSDVFIDL